MAKIKTWLMQMEEDAYHMTEKEFINEHGKWNLDLYEKAQTILTNREDIQHG